MKSAKAITIVLATVVCLLLLGVGAFVVKKVVSSSAPPANRDATKHPTNAEQAGGPAFQFAQGTSIELLGISDAPADPARWWAADGTAISPPAKRSTGHDRTEEKRLFQVVLRRIDPPERGNAVMWVALANVAHIGVSSRTEPHAKGDPEVEVQTYTFTLPETPPAATLQFNFAAGPWVKDERYTLPDTSASTGASKSTASAATAPARDLTITRATDGKDGLEVAITWAPGVHEHVPLDDDFVVVTRDGHELSMERVITEPGRSWPVMGFDVRRADALELRRRSRPYEQREIQNVSLTPGVKTSPTIEVPINAGAGKAAS